VLLRLIGKHDRIRTAPSRLDAMKVLLPSIRSSSAEITTRFEREIRVHASLRHPNIAELYTAFSSMTSC
ncbi:MAG: hypothetical protein QM757_40055, partial [Paludibaculum sp.]